MSRMMNHGQEKKKNDQDYHGGQTISIIFTMNMPNFFRIFRIVSLWVDNYSSVNLITLGLWQ